ncbi:MAG: DUF736 family protein, partial [Rhodospirillales bacterium]|nr:DUF736 family protein [Rhodospirillales bacterium]
RAPGQPLEALPGLDLLLVSHNHYDHLDLPTLRRVRRRWSPPAVTGLDNARHLAKAGLHGAVELDWWQSVDRGGARVTYVPAQHFSARTLWDRNRSLWGGFVIEAGGATVYFAGDSGYCPHFAEIGAAWSKRSNEGRDYLSLKLDDPSFTAPIFANLFDDEDGDGFTLIWSRPNKRNGD